MVVCMVLCMVVLGIVVTSISSFSDDVLMRLTTVETLLRLVFTKLFVREFRAPVLSLIYIHYYFYSIET